MGISVSIFCSVGLLGLAAAFFDPRVPQLGEWPLQASLFAIDANAGEMKVFQAGGGLRFKRATSKQLLQKTVIP